MAALLRTLTILSSIGYILSKQACITDTDCDLYPAERCSSNFDLTCYKVFNSSDFANATIYITDGTDITGDSGIDTENMLDHDTSTAVTLPSAYIFYRLEFILKGDYWVHHVELQEKTHKVVQNWYIDGVLYSMSSSTASYGYRTILTDATFPMKMNNMSVEVMQFTANYEVIDMIIAGAYDTPQPSVAPTQTPTDATFSPTAAPTTAPSYSPSAAPTSYPTPDVCEEYLVTQPCCGHFGYEVADDKVNIRDATLLTCERKVTTGCCGTSQPFTESSTTFSCGSDYYSRSDDPAVRSASLCYPTYFNTSVNGTDDIVGEVLSGNNTVYTQYSECDCEWTLYECEGNDTATCGTNATWNDLRDSCNTTWTIEDDFIDEACWDDIIEDTPSMEHILWEPCSAEAFIGSVTEVQMIPNELVHNNTCTCSYAIRNCFVLEDRSKRTQCDFDTDCASDSDCTQELAAPCCGYDGYEDGVYLGVTAALDTNGYPNGSWSCNNEAELCPDIFDGTRKFTAESQVNWWYDLDANAIEETCGCLYVTDECNLPTVSPTTQPTADPSPQPTDKPTDEDSHASFIAMSYIAYCMVFTPLLFM